MVHACVCLLHEVDLLADSQNVTELEHDLHLSKVLGLSRVHVCCTICHRTVCHTQFMQCRTQTDDCRCVYVFRNVGPFCWHVWPRTMLGPILKRCRQLQQHHDSHSNSLSARCGLSCNFDTGPCILVIFALMHAQARSYL